MTKSISVVIVEKNASLKLLTIKDYKEEDLYKKCSFKKSEGFIVQTIWNTKLNGQKYAVELWAKSEGKAGTENKYEFPPPVDKTLFFGACILVGYLRDDSEEKTIFNLTVPLWTAIYEKLFGGFQDLTSKNLEVEDEDDEEELDEIPKEKKTKTGYLKDIIDSNSEQEDDEEYASDTNSDECTDTDNTLENIDEEEELELLDVGSELSEESYDYSDDE